MELAQLEIFKAVGEERSITRAAERLHRVPSNVTTRIKQLEAELGVDLFIREHQRLRLSAIGEQLMGYASRILALTEEAKYVASCREPHGPFALGSLESTAAVRIPEILARYHKQYPEVTLQLTTRTSGDLITGMLDGDYLAAFTDGPPRALLDSLGGRKGVVAHKLAPEHGQVQTWLIWRKGLIPANVAALSSLL